MSALYYSRIVKNGKIITFQEDEDGWIDVTHEKKVNMDMLKSIMSFMPKVDKICPIMDERICYSEELIDERKAMTRREDKMLSKLENLFERYHPQQIMRDVFMMKHIAISPLKGGCCRNPTNIKAVRAKSWIIPIECALGQMEYFYEERDKVGLLLISQKKELEDTMKILRDKAEQLRTK